MSSLYYTALLEFDEMRKQHEVNIGKVGGETHYITLKGII